MPSLFVPIDLGQDVSRNKFKKYYKIEYIDKIIRYKKTTRWTRFYIVTFLG